MTLRRRVLTTRSAITFCIMVVPGTKKTPWLKRTIQAIRSHCSLPHCIRLLSQGEPDKELLHVLQELGSDGIDLIISPTNLRFGGGRRLLGQRVTTPYMMMLDDDMYLTAGTIEKAISVFQKNQNVGAVSMPQYDVNGQLISVGGKVISIRNGVIHIRNPTLRDASDFVTANHLNAGALLYRIEMEDTFSWDPQAADFEDLDKSLSAIKEGKWLQGIIPQGRLIHDRSWLGHTPRYERVRFDAFSLRRSYRYIRHKWGIRMNLRDHILYEIVFPVVSLTGSRRILSGFASFLHSRSLRNVRRLGHELQG